MLIKDILSSAQSEDQYLSIVSEKCSRFIEESEGFPLLKNLPTSYNDVYKVKVRKQKKTNEVSESFNEAFKNQLTDLRQRSIFAYASYDLPIIEEQEMFYVFPIDGFKYMYNSKVTNSGEEYKEAIDKISEQFGNDNQEAIEIITELLQYTYTSTNLVEGLRKGAEVIVYSIPYYYAVRASIFEDYNQLLTSLP